MKQSNLSFRVGGNSFSFARVEHGSFMMGAPDSDKGVSVFSKPCHKVDVLDDYYISETLVTQSLWKSIMGHNPSRFKGDTFPVEAVSWEDVQDFLAILNSRTGKEFRLPTEIEWEFAARGGNYSQGYLFSGSDNPDEVAWSLNNSDKTTHPVAMLKANELGLYDMSGNVLEWCADEADRYRGYYLRDYEDNLVIEKNDKILRSFNCQHKPLGIYHRGYAPADLTEEDIIGFRLALFDN